MALNRGILPNDSYYFYVISGPKMTLNFMCDHFQIVMFFIYRVTPPPLYSHGELIKPHGFYYYNKKYPMLFSYVISHINIFLSG